MTKFTSALIGTDELRTEPISGLIDAIMSFDRLLCTSSSDLVKEAYRGLLAVVCCEFIRRTKRQSLKCWGEADSGLVFADLQRFIRIVQHWSRVGSEDSINLLDS